LKRDSTWGEICYFAYNLPTLEFHSELYGALHEKFISAAASEDEAKRRSFVKTFDLEVIAIGNTTKQNKKWSELRNGVQENPYPVTLSTFIRHEMHHPESKQVYK